MRPRRPHHKFSRTLRPLWGRRLACRAGGIDAATTRKTNHCAGGAGSLPPLRIPKTDAVVVRTAIVRPRLSPPEPRMGDLNCVRTSLLSFDIGSLAKQVEIGPVAEKAVTAAAGGLN